MEAKEPFVPEPVILLRPEEPGDAGSIAQTIEAAFGSSAEAQLVAALREAGALCGPWSRSRMARIVGHVALSPVAVGGISGGDRWLGLAPLAVRQSGSDGVSEAASFVPPWRCGRIAAGRARVRARQPALLWPPRL